jgi:hypothetical protein
VNTLLDVLCPPATEVAATVDITNQMASKESD